MFGSKTGLRSRTMSYLKLNTSLLKDETYKNQIEALVEDTIKFGEENNFDKRLTWDLCKTKIREMSINFSKLKVKKEKSEIQCLEEELKAVQSTIDEGNENSELIERLYTLQEKCDNLVEMFLV